LKRSLSSFEFSEVYHKTKSLVVGDLLFKYKLDDNPKIGFIVSRKYGNAYHRALFKRRCRSLFKKYRLLGFGCTIILKPNKTRFSYRELEVCFNELYKNYQKISC